MAAEEPVRAIGRAKAAVDNGFSRVGRTLSSGDRVAAWLQRSAGRVIALADAVVLLCREHHAAEAAPLARAAMQAAARMRWIASGRSEERLDRLGSASRWTELLDDEAMRSFLSESGADAAQARAWAESSARLLQGHVADAGAALPWGHAFGSPAGSAAPADALEAAARSVEEAVRALDARWPGSFAP